MAIAAFIANVLISRQLGPSARGEVAFVLQASYLVAPLIMLGADRSLLRRDSESNAIISRRHLLPCGVIISLILLAFFHDWRALAGVVAFGTSWLVVVRSNALREHSFKLYLWLLIAYSTSVTVLCGILYILDTQDWTLWLLPYVIPAAGFAIFDISRNGVRCYSRPFVGITRLSLRLLPASFALIVTMRADRIMLPFLAGNAQLGLYIAVATSTEAVAWIAGSIADHRVSNTPFAPQSTNSLVKSLLRDSTFFAVIALGVGTATYYLLIPLLGASYYPGRELVVPLTLAAVAFALYRQAVAWTLAGPSPGNTTILECATASFAIPIYAAFIIWCGALGAAWATLIVNIIGVIIAITIRHISERRPRTVDA